MRTHAGIGQYQCDICDKRFTQSYNLKYHMKAHEGEKSFQCMKCDKCFTRPSNLTRHMRVHTGSMPYSCTKYNKCFAWATSLREHMRSHARVNPDRWQKSDSRSANTARYHGVQGIQCRPSSLNAREVLELSSCITSLKQGIELIEESATGEGIQTFRVTLC